MVRAFYCWHKVENVDCGNKVLSSIFKEIDGVKRELNAKNNMIVKV